MPARQRKKHSALLSSSVVVVSVILCRSPYVTVEFSNCKLWTLSHVLNNIRTLIRTNVYMTNMLVIRSDTSEWTPGFENNSPARIRAAASPPGVQ